MTANWIDILLLTVSGLGMVGAIVAVVILLVPVAKDR